jgi:hypothetical protein
VGIRGSSTARLVNDRLSIQCRYHSLLSIKSYAYQTQCRQCMFLPYLDVCAPLPNTMPKPGKPKVGMSPRYSSGKLKETGDLFGLKSALSGSHPSPNSFSKVGVLSNFVKHPPTSLPCAVSGSRLSLHLPMEARARSGSFAQGSLAFARLQHSISRAKPLPQL